MWESQLVARQDDFELWTLVAALAFVDPVLGLIMVEAGFRTNFASIKPLRYIPWLYVILDGYGNRAAALHDYLYTGVLPRKDADEVFYRALQADGVPKWRAWLMYAGVRAFGGLYYKTA